MPAFLNWSLQTISGWLESHPSMCSPNPARRTHFLCSCDLQIDHVRTLTPSEFAACKALYDQGFLNDGLLPITSIIEPEREEEVKAILAEGERRKGFERVSLSMDPQAVPPVDGSAEAWHSAQIDVV